ncbi:hypothetical protein CEP54_012731 [Fusarium duplospermum]|uniref:Uncharacterized protein n=1 Tax=Fusarium duplospermum TaxID=1325734 RepID=A0A428P6Z1_9HYPO|nr:hypothetical protein CEP54_012731 [Fusarium duplospermum]
MACNVGSANPDIAGLGIMISFALQAGLSLCLSILSLSLWKSAVLAADQVGASMLRDITDTVALIQALNIRWGEIDRADLTVAINTLDDHRPNSRLRDLCEIFLAVLDQPPPPTSAAALNPTTSIGKWMWKWAKNAALKKKYIDDLLATISDIQVVNAIGLLIAALAQHKSLSLYHLHVVYDTASFTGVSICASIINVSASAHNLRWTRTFAMFAYLFLFFSFSVVFGIKLSNWDENVTGKCYNTRRISSPNGSHPSSDIAYLAVTCFYSIYALWSCSTSAFPILALACFSKQPFQSDLARRFTRKWEAFLGKLRVREVIQRGRFYASIFFPVSMHPSILVLSGYFTVLAPPRPEIRVWVLVPLAMLQYPLHLYMAIAIRKDNDRFLEGGSENDWGFGQIVALVLCAATCIECIRGVSGKRDLFV